jgi:hypothetical protein
MSSPSGVLKDNGGVVQVSSGPIEATDVFLGSFRLSKDGRLRVSTGELDGNQHYLAGLAADKDGVLYVSDEVII